MSNGPRTMEERRKSNELGLVFAKYGKKKKIVKAKECSLQVLNLISIGYHI